MVQWVELVIVYLCVGLLGASSEHSGLERIEKCATYCSQGLHCKSKPGYLFAPPCQNPTEGLNTSDVFHNVSFSTVMRCTGRQKCSLQLKIETLLQLTGSIHGLSICTSSAGMMMKCQSVSFTKTSRQRLSGQTVKIENDCSDIVPNQQVEVVVKTVPSYCGISWTSAYYAPGCNSDDLWRHVPECITGQLSYEEDPEKKELSISVSGMLDNVDYNLRLCYKSFICIGMGSSVLIKKEEPVKRAVLSYSQPLPCLCIEGWSAVMDARRVQVCPFKDRLKELWTGITFNSFEETLLWEPSCPVSAVVSLCQKRQDDICVNLPHSSQNSSREKITFTRVDKHPDLCMKFTIGAQSWTKCPFADRVQGWKVDLLREQEHTEVKMLSQVTGLFSVELCEESADAPECHTTETHSIHVEKHKVSKFSIQTEQCSFCLLVKRLDLQYAVTIKQCFNRCSGLPDTRAVVSKSSTGSLNWIVVPVGVCVSTVLVITLVFHVLLTVYEGGKQKRKPTCSSDAPALSKALTAAPSPAGLQRAASIPESPCCGNSEKTNLISK